MLPARESAAQRCYVINVPKMAGEGGFEWIGDRFTGLQRSRAGIAWWNRFNLHDNYVEVRAIYDDEGPDLHFNVADLFVWWDASNGMQWGGEAYGPIDQWDAIEVALDPAPADDGKPSPGALRLMVANYPYNDPVGFPETALPHALTLTWRWSGGAWQAVDDPEAAGAVWYHQHGSTWNEDPGPNDNTTEFDNGTMFHIFIPWSSLGMDEPPSGSVMQAFFVMYDVDDPRDGDAGGMDPPPSERGSSQAGPLPPAVWPPSAVPDDTSLWGVLVFNQAPYAPPAVASEETLVLLPAEAPVMRDVTVGGHSFIEDRWLSGGGSPDDYRWDNCMETRFGEAGDLYVHPEGGPTHMCFFDRALFYYDLAGVVPDGNVVTRAELSLHHFGGDSNEHPGDPNFEVRTSPVQVHRIEGEWMDLPLDQCVTWNTAPLAAENAGFGLVTPDVPEGGKRVVFDVTPIVARAVLAGEAASFALYGADTGANTGKYFASSETGWGESAQPLLTVTHGPAADPSSLPDEIGCSLGVSEEFFVIRGTGTPELPEPIPEDAIPEPLPEPAQDASSDALPPDGGEDDGGGGGCGCSLIP
jgi:hypothetical protein